MLYQSAGGGGGGSTLGQAGMPTDGGSGDGDGFVNIIAEIGCCLEAVRKFEHKKKAPQGISRLEQRFRAYTDMLEARNELPYAEYQADLAYHEYNLGLRSLSDYQEAEETAERIRERLRLAKKENDRLRRGKLYVEEVGIMNEQMKLRQVRI